MRKFLLILTALLLAFAVYWFFIREKKDDGPKQQPLTVKKHSATFNQSVQDFLQEYFKLQASFVDADTNGAKIHTKNLLTTLDSLELEELKKDTSGIYQSAQMQVNDIRANSNALLMEKDITDMRQDFRMISENLYPFLKTINYEGPVVYWQNCGMPFGENTSANWVSQTLEIENPYLGKNHPKWKSAMLHCGEVLDSIYTK